MEGATVLAFGWAVILTGAVFLFSCGVFLGAVAAASTGDDEASAFATGWGLGVVAALSLLAVIVSIVGG